MYIGISKQRVYQMNIFAKQLCIPKNLLHIYLTMRSVSGWSDKALYPPIWQMWNDSDPIFHLLSLCLLGLAPTRTIRSPSQKKTQMFSFNRAGAGSQFNKGHKNYGPFSICHLSMTKIIWPFSISHWLRRIYVSASLYSYRPMRDRERSHNFCDLS